jgi:hypothetical protein
MCRLNTEIILVENTRKIDEHEGKIVGMIEQFRILKKKKQVIFLF